MFLSLVFVWEQCWCSPACILPGVFMGLRKPALFNIYREAILSTQPFINLNEGNHVFSFPPININGKERKCQCRDSKVIPWDQQPIFPFSPLSIFIPHTSWIGTHGHGNTRLFCWSPRWRNSNSFHFRRNKPTVNNLVNKGRVLNYSLCPYVSCKS